MNALPVHGRIACTLCYGATPVQFDVTKRTEGEWRITANPLAWSNSTPEIVVLGFSKGPTQAGALAQAPHDDIAYKGSRGNVGKILAHVGLIETTTPGALKQKVDQLIADEDGPFHFGSLIRCTVERYDAKTQSWKGSGGGMLDKFVATPFGDEVAGKCATRFLANLPDTTKLVLMFGLGTKSGYVDSAMRLFVRARPGNWKRINNVAYTDGRITVVHVEHFASQGALIPNWLGENDHERKQLGSMAAEAVRRAL